MKSAEKHNLLMVPPKGVEISATGLSISARLSYEQWFELGKGLQSIHKSILFWLGDWLLWGEHKWGEKFSQGVELSGYSAQTLANAQWVASRIEISRRSRELSWSHHQEVAMLDPDEQDKFLHSAVEKKLGVRELRAAVRLFRKPQPKLDWHETGDGPSVPSPPDDSQPEFDVMEHVGHSYGPQEYEEIGEQIAVEATRHVNVESDFNRLFGICKALRVAEKQHNDEDVVRLRTALDFFITEVERREQS
jgi:hypothetical protein